MANKSLYVLDCVHINGLPLKCVKRLPLPEFSYDLTLSSILISLSANRWLSKWVQRHWRCIVTHVSLASRSRHVSMIPDSNAAIHGTIKINFRLKLQIVQWRWPCDEFHRARRWRNDSCGRFMGCLARRQCSLIHRFTVLNTPPNIKSIHLKYELMMVHEATWRTALLAFPF